MIGEMRDATSMAASMSAADTGHLEALRKATNPDALEMNFNGIFLDEGRRILS